MLSLTPAPLSSLNVLIVEDNYPMRMLLRSMLAAAGLEKIRDAGDGREALALLRVAPADLVLLEYAMPGLNGLDVAQALRADPAHPAHAARLIMVTGYGDRAHVQAAYAAGIDHVLVKPISAGVLLERINTQFVAHGHRMTVPRS